MLVTADHVDYITITTTEDVTEIAQAYLMWAADALFKRESPLHDVRKWGSHGYEGWTCGPVSFGSRGDGHLLRVSGPSADAVSRWLPEDGYNVSRLDVAHTVWVGEGVYNVRGAVEESARAAAAGALSPVRRHVGLIDSGPEGQTLTVGSRTSVQYGRVYDKWRESGDDYYQGAWRFEVEYKAPLAKQVAQQLPADQRRGASIAATVGQWFGARGVDVPAALGGDSVAAVLPSRRSRSDQETLDWIRVQVAPPVSRLICAVGRDEVLYALGLHDCVQIGGELS